MNFSAVFIAALIAVAVGGCASQSTQDLRLGPKFTEEQKEMMTDHEKLAIYNAQVREEDKLVCEMAVVAGSHRPQKVCQTEKERAWNRASAREAVRKFRGGRICNEGVCEAP